MKKYKKGKKKLVDLNDRKNIKIIKSEQNTMTDSEMVLFEKQLEVRSNMVDEFCKNYIEKQVKSNIEISEEEFNKTIKELKKQHKILKSLIIYVKAAKKIIYGISLR